MVSLIVGIILIAFTFVACAPGMLDWGLEVIDFIKGALPVFCAFVGIIAIFIGFADIKDKKEAKREEAESDKQHP